MEQLSLILNLTSDFESIIKYIDRITAFVSVALTFSARGRVIFCHLSAGVMHSKTAARLSCVSLQPSET